MAAKGPCQSRQRVLDDVAGYFGVDRSITTCLIVSANVYVLSCRSCGMQAVEGSKIHWPGIVPHIGWD